MADMSLYKKAPSGKNSFFARNFLKSKFQGLGLVAIDSLEENTSVMIYFIPGFGLDKEKIDIFQIFKFVFSSRVFAPFFSLTRNRFTPITFLFEVVGKIRKHLRIPSHKIHLTQNILTYE